LPRFGAASKIYLVWDNFSAHKRALNLWTTRPANVEIFWTPTTASWLNLIEPWFLVLEKTALHNTHLKTTEAIAQNLKQGIDYLNNRPPPLPLDENDLNIAILMNRITSYFPAQNSFFGKGSWEDWSGQSKT